MNVDFLVLGAGLSGLSAALELSKKGKKVLVLEKEEIVGGLARTLGFGEFSFDLGPHRFHTKKPKILSKVRGLVGDELDTKDRLSHIFLYGNFVKYPLSINSVLALPALTLARSIIDLGKAKFFSKTKNEVYDNFEDTVTQMFGKTLYDIYFGPYTEKVWGIPPKEISSDWASDRIKKLRIMDIMKGVLMLRADKTPRTLVSKFYYPKNGIGSLSLKMKEGIERNGGRVLTNSEVSAVKVYKNNIVLVKASNRFFRPRNVISTIPVNELVGFMQPRREEKVTGASRGLRFRDVVFLFIKVKKEGITKNNWIYFPEKGYFFNRVSEQKNFSLKMCPDGASSITVEVTCFKDDACWSMSDKELFSKCIQDLERAELVKGEEVQGFEVLRQEAAYPIYDLCYKENLKLVMDYLKSVRNLVVAGRCGLFKYTNMDDSIEMGVDASKHFN